MGPHGPHAHSQDPTPATRNDSALLAAINLSSLQRMQDHFAALGHVTLYVCDTEGRLVTRPSCTTDFCRSLTGSPSGLEACCRSVTDAALATDKSALRSCHAGIAHYAAEIRVDGRHLGTIVLGDRHATFPKPREVIQLAARYGIDANDLVGAAERMEPTDPERRVVVGEYLGSLVEILAQLCRQNEQMTQRIRELETVHDLAEMLSGREGFDDILRSTLGRICAVMGVKAASIRLLNEETGELQIKAVHNLSQRYLDKGPVMLTHATIDASAFAGETVYVEDLPSDPRVRYPLEAREEGLVSGLAVPMTHRGKTVGVVRVYSDRPYRFSEFECALLRSVGSHVAAAILNHRLYQNRLVAERYQRQLQQAGSIQRRMIPELSRRHKDITFGCIYSPTLEVGGDFFDFVDLPRGNLGFCIADVVGKGITAALLMASARAALRAHAHSIYHLDDILSLVNRHMCRDGRLGEFVTLFYGVFAPDGKRLTYCNAGHDPPLLFRGDELIELDTGGMVIGVRAETRYERAVVDLRSGDLLVFYTDGVTDAWDFSERRFTRERLIESVRRHRRLDTSNLAKELLWDVRRFVGLANQLDDITLVVAKVG